MESMFEFPEERPKSFLPEFANADSWPALHLDGYKESLRLKAFDPSLPKGMPVETLYIIPLACKSYSRTFRNKLRHTGSFVGRDFKELIQVLHPLGRLSSLIKHAVTDVTDLLFQLDVQLLREGFPKQDSTFKPKFIREHLFKTNRHSISRDVTTRFGNQFTCRHLCNGGSYVVERPAGNGTRSVRSSIGDFVKLAPVNFPGFNLHFFGSRVNSDNSGLLTLTLCDTLGGVFQSNGQFFLVSNCSEQQCKLHYTPAVVIDNYNNIVVLPLGGLVEVNKDDINIVQAVDIHLFVGSSNNQKFLNVAKFGMFWWMLMNIAKIY
ncbi:hypothetical protein PHYBLDRAFT_139237 [Phycomyces blakesleeanus NRRL 1555(-)]|uniref:Uncharacterized protein n=1 Tax=Phycomyces blakesleeanus (strain ATCC 8743b / DSM 1359 / FGSC 10004 / NBRC 33097 / NRRL 1555) TaxID=763407 RepID=A0A162V0L2_PHYB8|nr:hypothetical protein PHYBLDRAFT_139237 [Phycomyces blakesleeanus NRRL 1555(-)]OAD79202.1 hypothetical protein PHYBLDRAFT_139237 [Phycomyces blakesleeanus NRRL 1555(-)]|eukprot:XP_018297242.1 hypothetical protein PHYBLDRAFT_139237 [Phycomyces blakesleeanus NRRL 1555(-)]